MEIMDIESSIPSSYAFDKSPNSTPLYILCIKPLDDIFNLLPSCSLAFPRFALYRIQGSPSPLFRFSPELSEEQSFRLF
jgi:hypothetical protein